MSDEIAIASLLMAILAIIYGTWYPEIMKAINLNVPDHDKMENYSIANQTFRGKCLPLTVISILVVIIFLPTIIPIISHSVSVFMRDGISAYKGYNTVKMGILFVIIVSVMISIQMLQLSYALRKKCKALETEE